ncbi:MAG: O-succinylhomoserine sulfhydrylase [Burkholderiales bacterium]|nr:O-succinylhomoserine sulfhydrylase [Burkholderiales bacterium]MBK8665062.1 O-succinylhomoserine sulfhydrylase [Burkholderiales bacterium]
MSTDSLTPSAPPDGLPPDLHIDTLAVRVAVPRSQWGEHSEALYLTSCFVQPDAETSARRFAMQGEGYTYTRTSNPSVTSFERRLAALEGAENAIATASGMSAILLMGMGLLKSGDHVICSQSMFGSTIKLFGSDFAKFGVQTTFVSQTDVAEWRAAVRPNTRLLFAETPTNPLTEVCDIAALASIAHDAGALLAVDNVFATPVLQKPLALGADLVIHSGTKFLDGQGRVMAGAICGPRQYIDQVFAPLIRSAGMVLSPFNAWVVQKGMETLGIRVKAQSANALQLAQWLERHPAVERVVYPGLPSHPQHALAMAQQSDIGGSVIAFAVRADSPEQARVRAFHVVDSCRVCSIATNLGDVKTLISHPASTSHGRLSEAQRQAAGVTQGLLRLSVGLEHVPDIQADLARGLDSLGEARNP